MGKYVVLFFSLSSIFFISCKENQQAKKYNFGFEDPCDITGFPSKWTTEKNPQDVYDFEVLTDKFVKHDGSASVRISSKNYDGFECQAIKQIIPLTKSGSELELRAFFKLEHADRVTLLLCTEDECGNTLGAGIIETDYIRGEQDWTQRRVKIPIPKGSKNIQVGVALEGGGKVWVDDFSLYIDGQLY